MTFAEFQATHRVMPVAEHAKLVGLDPEAYQSEVVHVYMDSFYIEELAKFRPRFYLALESDETYSTSLELLEKVLYEFACIENPVFMENHK